MEPKPTKPLPECAEGPEASRRFAAMMMKLLSVPRAVIVEREREHRRQVDSNPNRRGPKRKAEIQALVTKLEAEKARIDAQLQAVRRHMVKRPATTQDKTR